MASPLLFSLPVHERPDIAKEQIENIRHFAPNSLVCLHVSPAFDGNIEEFHQFETMPGVFINRRRLVTGHGSGLFHVHVDNFRYMNETGESFRKILLISSNELLFRKGIEEHTSNVDAGCQLEIFDQSNDWHVYARGIEHNPKVVALLNDIGLPVIFGGQAEGQFYSFEMFVEMANLFQKHFTMEPAGFEVEEIFPQTVFVALMDPNFRVVPPTTFANYCNFVDITVTLINKMRSDNPGIIFSPKRRGGLRSPHIGIQNLDSVFSVKRVPRESGGVREYIYSLDKENPRVGSIYLES